MCLQCTRWVFGGYFIHFLVIYLQCTCWVHWPLPPVTVHSIGHHTQCLRETASTSPTCRWCQCPSHQIPDHSWPSTQPVLNIRPGHLSVTGKGTRSEGSEPMRNRGLDPGSVMDEDKDDKTLSGFDQQTKHNVVDSPGTTEELLH